MSDEEEADFETIKKVCWTFTGNAFKATGQTTKKLPAGFYEVFLDNYDNDYFQKMIMPKPAFSFENKIADNIIKEIHHFWKSANLFDLFNQPHRRGVLLHGPAGTGKSTLVYRICHSVIENDGICIKFPERISFFKKALKSFRDIHPDRPVFVLMEDLDELYKHVGLGGLTNVIDGTESQGLDNILYLATTNHLDRLPEVFTNRPSRFDMVVKIGSPDTQTRINFIKEFAKFYTDFSKKFPSFDEIGKDTKGFSFAHLKEMFLAVAIFNHSYKDALKRMRDLSKVDVTASGNDD